MRQNEFDNAVKTAKELGRKRLNPLAKFIWLRCVDCGKGRWLDLVGGKSKHVRCSRCSQLHRRGNNSQGIGKQYGYITVNLSQDDFFYPMANSSHRVFEHRLVMAKSLGRCLHLWEIVHHKNHIRGDNRIENLQLVSDDRHKQLTLLEGRIAFLEKRVTLLEAENILLKLKEESIYEKE